MVQSNEAASSEAGGDDIVMSFRTERSGMVGRIVRLGPAVDTILTRHDYPPAVAEVLGEALAAAALIGSGLKFPGRFIVQTKSDGPLGFLVVNYETPGKLRGYASFDAARLAAHQADGKAAGSLLGEGHLAMTIDPDGDMERYQGVVALDGASLGDAVLGYFRQSEQLPTFVRLAVARVARAGGRGWHWRAGGLMVQSLAPEGGHGRSLAEEEGEALAGADDDAWRRVEMLAATVEAHELTDPTLTPERLLFRLLHEEGVRVYAPAPLDVYCRCSRERVGAFLTSFADDGMDDMRDADGSVTVTCEFCRTPYRFEAGETT